MKREIDIVHTVKLFQGRPWNRGRYLGVRPACYSMLTGEEIRLLYWLAHDYATQVGEIIDAGAFVGGSTNALTQGLIDSGKNALVRSFDLFVCGSFEGDLEVLGRPGKGASFRELFDRNTASVQSRVEVNHGDICAFSFPNPIEILFLDCLKAPHVNDFVVGNLFPRLVPGRSVVVQQDYLHECLPWIHVAMELFDEYFLVLADTDVNSVAYLCIKEISLEKAAAFSWEAIDRQERLRLMDLAISKWNGKKREFLVKARARI